MKLRPEGAVDADSNFSTRRNARRPRFSSWKRVSPATTVDWSSPAQGRHRPAEHALHRVERQPVPSDLREDGTLATAATSTVRRSGCGRAPNVAVFLQDACSHRRAGSWRGRAPAIGTACWRWNVTPRLGAALLLNEWARRLPGGFACSSSGRRPWRRVHAVRDHQRYALRRRRVTPLFFGPSVRFAHVLAARPGDGPKRDWDLSYLSRRHTLVLHASVLDRQGSHELILDPLPTDGRRAVADVEHASLLV